MAQFCEVLSFLPGVWRFSVPKPWALLEDIHAVRKDHKSRKDLTVRSVSCTYIFVCVRQNTYMCISENIPWCLHLLSWFWVCKHLSQLTVIRIPQSRNLPALLSCCLWEKEFCVSPSSETGKLITCVQCVDKPKLLWCNSGQIPLLLRSEPDFCDFGS